MDKQRYIFLDTETTGLDSEVNQVIQVGAIVIDEDENDVKTEIARINFKIPLCDCAEVELKALQVNKVSALELVLDEAEEEEGRQYAANLAQFFIKYVTPNAKIIGHNIQFDIDFIKAYLEHYGFTDRGALFGRHRLIDTITIAFFLSNAGYIDIEGLSLSLVADVLLMSRTKYGHDAMYDALLTADVYFELRNRISPEDTDGLDR